MITNIKIKNFKKFGETNIKLDDGETLFVGQNNGGKTTALQALTLWSFLVNEWNRQKGKSKAKNRTGVQITRNALSAIPVRDMRYIWKNGQIKEGSRSSPIPVEIEISGTNKEGVKWKYGIQLTYGSKETIYCKPIGDEELPEDIYNIFQLPPLSGVQTDEKRLLLGAQLKAIGEGRPGEILRTLLWEIYSDDINAWNDIQVSCGELFGINLQKISFNEATDAYIEILYVPVDNETQSKSKSKKKTVTMEISSLGSGTLQFLLLAAFMYKHKNSLILLDEPDSHMHVFLQKRTYEWIRLTARKNNCQVIIATHSEVLIDAAKLESVVGFFGNQPKPLPSREVNPLLKNVSSIDIIHAAWKNVLYSEGDTDLRILRAFAQVLEHPILPKLETPFHYDFSVHEFQGDGTNHLSYVLKHFSALKNIRSNFKGACIRDAGQRVTENLPNGLEVYYWKLPEIENYLIHPEAIIRFLSARRFGGLFEEKNRLTLNKSIPERLLENPHNQEGLLGKGSDFLERYLNEVEFPNTSKGDFYEIALSFTKDEVFPEIKEKLDLLNSIL